jgi:hypothetical protein
MPVINSHLTCEEGHAHDEAADLFNAARDQLFGWAGVKQ